MRMVGLALDYYVWARTGLRIMLNNGEVVDSTGEEALEAMLEVGDNGLDIKGQALLPHRGLCQWRKAYQSSTRSTRSTVKCPLLWPGMG